MKTHTTIGAQMLAGSPFALLEMAEQIALTHHEKWDGSGYPGGLAGEAIPIVGRIVAVADVFDALTHSRPYKPAWSIPDAIAEIDEPGGAPFRPAGPRGLPQRPCRGPASTSEPIVVAAVPRRRLIRAPTPRGHHRARCRSMTPWPLASSVPSGSVPAKVPNGWR